MPFLEDAEVGEKFHYLAICEVKSVSKDGKNKPMEFTLDVKKLGEEGEMKMTKAVERAIGKHKELDEDEGTSKQAKRMRVRQSRTRELINQGGGKMAKDKLLQEGPGDVKEKPKVQDYRGDKGESDAKGVRRNQSC